METTRLETLWMFRFLFVVLLVLLASALSYLFDFYISDVFRFLLILLSLFLSFLIVPSKPRKKAPPPET